MRSAFLSILIIAFISVFTVNAADFHCAGISSHQVEGHSHDHATGHASGYDVGHDAGHESDHEGCAPHMHSCCSVVFVFQSENKISLPLPDKTVFSENIYLLKPAPVLDGPFQPPRLS